MLHGRADECLQVARALLPRPCAPEQPESVRPSATRRAPAHRSAAGLAGRRRDGVPVAQFATDYQGCAGPLRSMIASGALGGVQVGDLVVPDGFSQGFNPGAHLGSVDEIAFIEQATGLDRAGVEALCDSLARAAHRRTDEMIRDVENRRPRRPTLLGKAALDSLGGSPDPAELAEAAHATASLLVESGRATTDDATRARLVRLVDDVGLDTVAEMWAGRPARSLPGALWRLYALREWVRTCAVEASADFAAGQGAAPVPHVVAGAADPPTPEALRALLDEVLHGVFAGDLDVALERAGAFCRVVVAGRVARADDLDLPDPAAADALTHSSAALSDTAEDLEAAAVLWRRQDLV